MTTWRTFTELLPLEIVADAPEWIRDASGFELIVRPLDDELAALTFASSGSSGSSLRPEWDEVWMDLAVTLSRRSTCSRLSVGCVVVSFDNTRVLSIGYNGGAAGQRNGCDSVEPGACGCIHAEINAMIKLDFARRGPVCLYTTVSPCVVCARAIVNSRIEGVVFRDHYRDSGPGLDVLRCGGVGVVRRE